MLLSWFLSCPKPVLSEVEILPGNSRNTVMFSLEKMKWMNEETTFLMQILFIFYQILYQQVLYQQTGVNIYFLKIKLVFVWEKHKILPFYCFLGIICT